MSTRVIKVKDVLVGGDNPIVIQSMTNTDTKDVKATLNQINELHKADCEIVRLSVYDLECIPFLKEIIKQSPLPIIADVHFDYRIALECIKAGVAKLRINPGNIGDEKRVKAVALLAKEYNVPIRVGANSGSLPKDLIIKHGGVNENSIVEAALLNVKMLEDCGFYDICISVKSSNVPLMVKSYEMISKLTDYPLHLGVTEAGGLFDGSIKSAVGIGSLLLKGIGNTVRVSVTGDPVREIAVAKKILRACGKYDKGLNIISCPTCARTGIDVEKIADMVEDEFSTVNKKLDVAVMGCVVNGPGEAKEADIGIAGGKSGFILFKKGEIFKTFKDKNAIDSFIDEIKIMIDEEK